MKVRFLCARHNIDLGYDTSHNLLIPETNADITKEYTPITLQEYTGYFLFDLSECFCTEDEGNQVDMEKVNSTINTQGDGPYVAEGDVEYTPSQCQDYWRVVIYAD